MATIKFHTDLEQSRKLAEILSFESADMYYMETSYNSYTIGVLQRMERDMLLKQAEYYKMFPCWSLASLLNILDYPQLSKDRLGSGKTGWMVSVYPKECRHDSCWHDNPVDACVEMVIKLHELNLL